MSARARYLDCFRYICGDCLLLFIWLSWPSTVHKVKSVTFFSAYRINFIHYIVTKALYLFVPNTQTLCFSIFQATQYKFKEIKLVTIV